MPEFLNPFLVNKVKKNLMQYETVNTIQGFDIVYQQYVELLVKHFDGNSVKKFLVSADKNEAHVKELLTLLNLLTISEFKINDLEKRG